MPLKRPESTNRQARSPASDEERRQVVYDIRDVREQMDAVEQLLVAGIPVSRIEKEAKQRWKLTAGRTKRLIDRVRQRWAEESRAERPHWKAQAIRRLYGHIAKARGEGQWNAVAAFERLLAEMQGTKEPVEIQLNVDATVTEAALHVVSRLTPERRAQIVAEQRRLRELAGRVVETSGTEVGTGEAQKPGSQE